MPKTRITRYEIPMSLLTSRMVRGSILDMMRYERATIASWSTDDQNGMLVLESEHFTPDRWASFGITPTVVGEY